MSSDYKPVNSKTLADVNAANRRAHAQDEAQPDPEGVSGVVGLVADASPADQFAYLNQRLTFYLENYGPSSPAAQQIRKEIERIEKTTKDGINDPPKYDRGREPSVGTRVKIDPAYGGGTGVVVSISPSGSFAQVKTKEGVESFHLSNLS